MFKQKHLILLAPLDWGLGHTTRIIPLLRLLLSLGCNVVVACNSTQKTLLSEEFPSLSYTDLDGYGIRYDTGRTLTRLALLRQAPKILTRIKKEHLWFLRYIAENPVSAVISDNRYGLWSPGIPSVLMTHQLRIKSGFGQLADRMANAFIRKSIRRFSRCWVPDTAGPDNLSGALSHPDVDTGFPIQYLGPLSRFESNADILPSPGSILLLLSGPEPQRTLLEEKLLREIGTMSNRKFILVRGLPGNTKLLDGIEGLQVYDHASGILLNQLILKSELVIARSGYTTIMDLVKLEKKMVLIPTPGQPEQEYLARHLTNHHIAPAMDQQTFSIAEALRLSAGFSYHFTTFDMEQYKTVVTDFIASLSSL